MAKKKSNGLSWLSSMLAFQPTSKQEAATPSPSS
jgi:hypothetical protein